MDKIQRSVYVLGRAIRETGQALERVGCMVQRKLIYKEQITRHRKIVNLYDKVPSIGEKTFIASSAVVVGDVIVGDGSSVWYGATLRGDVGLIKIGKNTSIGDRAIVHVSRHTLKGEHPQPTLIGDNVTIGEGSIIHGCVIEDEAHVEPGAIVMDGSVVSYQSVLSSGSLLKEGSRIPRGELWSGTPAKFARKLTEEERQNIAKLAVRKNKLANDHESYQNMTTEERDVEREKISEI